MRAYIHKNWCGVGDRLVVHPRGLTSDSPDIAESPRGEEAIAASRALYGKPFEATPADRHAAGPTAQLPLRHHSNRVFHFHPETLELIETFPNI